MRTSKSKLIGKILICVFSMFLASNQAISQNNFENREQTLKNGRQLSYCIFGDTEGEPVFYFHGFPGTYSDVPIFNGDEVAKQLNIKIIAINRPGYGTSTTQDTRTLLDWPDDIAEFADSLKINKFSILGYSGGGPFALSCAYKISERINKVVVVSGMGPFNAPEAKRGKSMTIVKAPEMMSKGMKKIIDEKPEKFEAKMIKSMPKIDQKVLSDSIVRNNFILTIKEAFKYGYSGTKQDAIIYKNSWGFGLQVIALHISLNNNNLLKTLKSFY